MNIKLLELRSYMIDENDDVYNMLQELPAKDEFEQTNEYNGMTKEAVKNHINKMMQHAYGLKIDDDYPQCENYILYVDGEPVVIGGLTLVLNDFWRKHRGNLFYKTRPSARNKGYATIFVELVVKRAKELGFKDIIAQCSIENIASSKVLENNGFVRYINPLCKDWDDTLFYKKQL